MTKYLLLLVSLILLCLPSGSYAGIPDIVHIGLNLKFDWTKKCAYGDAKITFTPKENTNAVLFDAADLEIFAVTENNKKIKFQYPFTEDSTRIKILFTRKINKNDTITIQISYRTKHENKSDLYSLGGSFGKGLRFFSPSPASKNKREQVWSSGEPGGNKYWFPCNDDLSDSYTNSLTVTTERTKKVIASGKLVSEISNQNGTTTLKYETEHAIPGYRIFVVAGGYEKYTQQSGKTTINTFGYPDEMEAVKATVELLPDMVQFISEKTKFPMPITTYNQVVVQEYPFPGLNGQHSGAIISDNYIDDYGVHKDWKYLWDGVAVQALASQWFGDLIQPAGTSDIWLSSAFTQYFAGLYTAKCHGIAEYQLYYLPFELGNINSDWTANNKIPVSPKNVADEDAFITGNYPKFRGALVLRLLHQELGDDLWWKSVQLFIKNHAYKQVTTTDFQKSVETVTGQSWQWFFDQWVYRVGMPELQTTATYSNSEGVIYLTIKQNQVPDSTCTYPQVNYFKGKIFIEVDDSLLAVQLEPVAETKFEFNKPTPPFILIVDPQQIWPGENIMEESVNDLMKNAANSLYISARMNAIGKLTDLHAAEKLSDRQKSDFYNLLMSCSAKDPVWRFRFNCLSTLRTLMPLPYDSVTTNWLTQRIQSDSSWVKTAAISMLGNTKDLAFHDIYVNALDDESDRVINAAAIAIGKSKHKDGLKILENLDKKSSWKNQSRISAMNGMQQLGHVNAASFLLDKLKDDTSARWYLATPTWDYPFTAAVTLKSLMIAEEAFPIINNRIKNCIEHKDMNELFQQLSILNILADYRGQALYKELKVTFAGDQYVSEALNYYEEQYLKTQNK